MEKHKKTYYHLKQYVLIVLILIVLLSIILAQYKEFELTLSTGNSYTKAIYIIFAVLIIGLIVAVFINMKHASHNLCELNYMSTGLCSPTSIDHSITTQVSLDHKQADSDMLRVSHYHVLVVDDMETNLLIVKKLLTLYNINATLVSNGLEAIDQIRRGQEFDLIIMDYLMPVMDGLETVKHIRTLGYDNPIIAHTASDIGAFYEIFLQSGFTDFLSKPINDCEWKRMLNMYMPNA